MSPQRDDFRAFTHTKPHIFRLFSALFFVQFVLFSILLRSVAISSYPCAHKHTFVPQSPSWNNKTQVISFVIYYCRWSHRFMTSPPLALLPLRMFLFIQTSLASLFFSPALSSSLHIYLDVRFSPLSLHLCPRIQLFCFQSCFHNNCDLLLGA